MSPMPQIPKLTIKTPITVAMTILPSQFDEAFRIPRSMGPTCFCRRGEPGRTRRKFDSVQDRLPQQGVTELKTHHKVAGPPSQPRQRGPFEAVNRLGTAPPVSGTGGVPLLAHLQRCNLGGYRTYRLHPVPGRRLLG